MAFVTHLPLSYKPFTPARSVCSLTKRPSTPVTPSRSSHALNMSVRTVSVFKDALLEKIMPLDFGRTIADSPRAQAEVEELVRQVEATNKSTSPGTDPNLSARWLCKYTTSTSILRVNVPKFLQPVEIIQYIDAPNLQAKNEEVFQIGPFRFTNAVEAKLSPRTPSLFNVKFIQFVLFGFLKFNVEKNPKFKGDLEVTYLDEDLRISRGNRGNLFVLVKDKSAKYP